MKREILSVTKAFLFFHLNFTLAVLLSLLLVFEPRAFAVEKPKKVYTIRYGTITPPGTPWNIVGVDLLMPIVRDSTGGRIKIVPYTSGVMGDDLEILEKMRRGEAEACGCTAPGIFEIAPELSVLSLPFLFSSYAEVYYVQDRLRPEIDRILDSKGFVRAAFVNSGFYHLYSRLDPSSLDKIRRQKIGNFWGKFELTTLKALGINPIPLNLARVSTLVLAGDIDGTIAPASGVLALQIYPLLSYMVAQPFAYNPAAGILSKKFMDQISDQLQKDPQEFQNLKADFERFQKIDPEVYLNHLGIPKEAWQIGRNVLAFVREQKLKTPGEVIPLVMNITRQSESSWSEMLINFENQTQDGFARRGMKIVRLSEPDMKEFLELSRKLQEELAGKLYPRELLDEILRLKKEFNEKALQDIFK